ncbi:hypothetical protein CVCC1112_3467 [Paenarthrobacter nicotinovorans]|nr:hypothetical protein CVCC1112_3467 [Paenarthrobacter nicotinovorans]
MTDVPMVRIIFNAVVATGRVRGTHEGSASPLLRRPAEPAHPSSLAFIDTKKTFKAQAPLPGPSFEDPDAVTLRGETPLVKPERKKHQLACVSLPRPVPG